MDKKITKGAGSIELEKAITFNELVSSVAPFTLVEKTPNEWRSFPISDQDGSGSCVAQTVAKMAGIHYWLENKEFVPFSSTYIYQQRDIRPMSGMGYPNFANIAKKGMTLEALVPSQKMSDEQMDAVIVSEYKKKVAEVFPLGDAVVLNAGNFDEIASTVINTGKPVMTWFYFTYEEWKDTPIVINPNLDKYDLKTSRHSVAVVDACKVNGVDCLIIEDSWGLKYAINGRRIITRDFFSKRNYFALYFRNFIYLDGGDKPKYTFKNNLSFGQTNADIVALQKILRYEALFPQDQNTTGYYGQLTANGVYQWQLKHNVASIGELAELQGKFVGNKTIKKLNELYS